MILNSRHTGIVVRDIGESISFYQQLGFSVINRDIETGFFIEQVTGIEGVKLEWVKLSLSDGFLLELLQYHTHQENMVIKQAPSNQLGCSHIAYTIDDIDEFMKIVVKNGGSIVNQAVTSANGKVKVAYCHDPEGVLLEVVEEL